MQSSPFLLGCSPGKKNLSDCTVRGVSKANLVGPIIRNQQNIQPISGIPTRKNSIEFSERDQIGPSSDVQLAETNAKNHQNPLLPGGRNRKAVLKDTKIIYHQIWPQLGEPT